MNDVTKSFLRERVLMVMLGLACLTLLGAALYFQFVEAQSPCPLCILQRYAYVLIAAVALLGSRSQSWRGIRVFEGLVVLCAVGGVLAAARLVWVQAFPGSSCGSDALQPVVDALPPAYFLPSVFKVQGLCETVYPPIFGLGMPMWGLITYLCMLIAVVTSLWYNRDRRGP